VNSLATYQPYLIAVWCRQVANNGVIVRSYPVDESCLKSGEMTQTATFPTGASETVRISIPDTAVLRAPGECDSRQEFFDRVMRTQFLTVNEGFTASAKVPFVLGDNSVTLVPQQGVVTVDSLGFRNDPGYRCAIAEAQNIELLSGDSDVAELEKAVSTHVLQGGDVIPVIAGHGSESVAGILMLEGERGLCFDCTLWTLAPIESKDEIQLRRKVRANTLNMDTGELQLVEFESSFGRFKRV
jgi:hypothetical protein